MLFVKALGIWLLILIFAVLNGMLREAVLLSAFGKPLALVTSGVLLSLVIIALSLLLVPRVGVLDRSEALRIGAWWLVLTLVFEFAFGRLVQHRTWVEILEAYTFKDGNIWPLVLLVTLFAPLIALRLRT
jgi:hypothetical protein